MQLSEKILDILGENNTAVPGTVLAETLGVGLPAVFEETEKLRARGYIIDTAADGAFRLSDDNMKLCASQLRRFCGKPVLFFDCTDSTNTEAKQLAERGAAEGTLVVSEKQSAGRGRLGRSFFSPEGGLYFSLILRPSFDPQMALYITTAAAVAAAEAIEAVSGKFCLIKWVNDIYLDGHKVCGILTEGFVNAQLGKLDYSILGVGINLTIPEGGFPDELKNIAGAVLKSSPATSLMKASLISDFTKRFFSFYSLLGEKTFLPEYRRRSFLTGREVEYSICGETHRAVVKGIDDELHLILTDNGSTIRLSAGEVRLKF